MGYVAGIDLGGAKMTVATYDGVRLLDVHTYEQKIPKNRSDALWMPIDYYIDDPYYHNTSYFFIEDALVGRGVRASLQIAQMEGALLSFLGRHYEGDNAVLMHVSAWKKLLIGDGGANKEKVASWLQTHHPAYASLCGGDQDCIDAACIGLLGTAIVAQSRSLTLTGTDVEHDDGAAWRFPSRDDPPRRGDAAS